MEWTIFTFQTLQSTTDTATVIKTQDIFTAPSMKLVPTVAILSDEISMITRRLVLSAMSNHGVQCWWCPHEMIVHLDGPKSIMGIWWLHITVTKNQKDFVCVDKDPEYVPGSHKDMNGALLYHVEGQCGSLPCLPYVQYRELTCAVCTKWEWTLHKPYVGENTVAQKLKSMFLS